MHALLTHLFLFPSLTFFCFLYRLSIKIKSILTPLRGSEGCKPRVINDRGLRLPEKKVHQISKIKAFLRHTRSEGGSTLLRAATDVRGCFPVPIFERRTAHRSDAQKGPTGDWRLRWGTFFLFWGLRCLKLIDNLSLKK